MTPAARISAAIEVLADIETRRRPAADALKDWGLSHRFAGSGDRAAIAGLTYDALRRKASAAFVMGEDTPRAVLLGMLRLERKLDVAAIAKLADGGRFAPSPLTDAERARLDAAESRRRAAVGRRRLSGMARSALRRAPSATSAPRKARRWRRARRSICGSTRSRRRARTRPRRWPISRPRRRAGRRRACASCSRADASSPAIHAEPAFIKGLIEVQDEGSQLAALIAGAKPGEQVIDLCAGAGGKTLALAAAMENKGQLYATDDDKRRLAPIHARLERADVRNVQVRTPRGASDVLADLAGHADLVLIDAPCTGTGSWRRNPDAKWRVRPGALEQRSKEQAGLLDRAAALVKPGGRIAYVTCSVLAAENGEQVRGFLARHPEFSLVPPAEIDGRARRARLPVPPRGADDGRGAVDDAAPHRHGRILRGGAAADAAS